MVSIELNVQWQEGGMVPNSSLQTDGTTAQHQGSLFQTRSTQQREVAQPTYPYGHVSFSRRDETKDRSQMG